MIKYNLKFSTNLGEDYLVVFDQKTFTGTAIDLNGTEGVLNIKSINNDDDRFSPILSKECVISAFIPTSQNISISDFIATEDDEWKVTITREPLGESIFQGYLVVEDSSQPLYDRPYPLTIRASDGLPLLKNVDLQKYDGTAFLKTNTLADYIGNILYYVNPDITFCIYFDIWHASMTTAHPFTQMQVDVRTFEQDETTFQDSYTVLETILNDTQCRLMYENGKWHIVSVWQYHQANFNFTEFELVAGVATPINADTPEIIAEVGKDKDIRLVNKDAIQYYKTASKSVKKTFNYEMPKEIICNQQLQRGAKLPLLSGPTYDAFELTCWEHYHNGILSTTPATNTAYIKREFDTFNYEKDRYIVLPTDSNNVDSAHLRTSRFYVGIGDKVDISVEIRHKNNYSGVQNAIVFYVLLRGDDGSFWSLEDNEPSERDPNILEGRWFTTTSTFSTARAIQMSYSSGSPNKDEWRTVGVNSEAIPVTGDIEIRFLEQSQGGYPNETWLKNIRVNYQPYIRESFVPMLGDFNIYSQSLKINKTIEETVHISDSPKKLIKGALFVNGQLATPEWHRGGVSESLRFMQIMTLIKYDYNFRQFHKIEGTLKGLSLRNASLENIPFGFLPQYSLTDTSSTSKYMLTSMDVNYLTGQWRGVLVEVQPGSTTFDTYDFQYIFK